MTKCARGARSFFAGKAAPQAQLAAVDEEFPGVPKTKNGPRKDGQITASTTSNGVKIASDSSEPYVATLGVEIAAGSRIETDATAGLSQLFAKMAFRATEARSDLRLFRDIEAIGGVVHKAAGRDFVRYNISVLPHQLDAAAEILAETTFAPRFAYWDVALMKEQVKLEVEAIAACSEKSIFENVHGAAFYDDATLGRPVVSLDNLDALHADDLAQFYAEYVNSAGLALVGSGMDHAMLTSIANEYFGDLQSVGAVAKASAKYVGGESRVKKLTAKNTYVALGFHTGGKTSADNAASHVLKALLTTRLNSKKANGFLANYDDAGIVGLRGFAAPADAGALVDSFIAEIKNVATAAPSADELAAAKTAAGIEAVDARASRQGKLALLGATAFSQKVLPSPLAAAEAVTAKAVQELAQKALASRPSLASVGKLSTVPRLDAVINKLK